MSGISVVIMMLAILYSVILRHVFDHAVIGATELSIILLGIFMFLGIAYDEAEGAHVRVEAAVQALPPRLRILFTGVITPVFVLMLCGILVWQGVELANNAVVTHQLSHTTWRYPAVAGIVWVPLGFLFAGIFALRTLTHVARAQSSHSMPSERLDS
jgi:TRAP-type C4-dicarboxylate transport system permease small subunit